MPNEGDAFAVSRADFLRLIEALIKNHRLKEAERLVDNLPDDGPLATDKLFLLGKIAQAKGDYIAAERYYRAILRNNPNFYRVRLDLAQSLFERGNFEAADYHFRLVLAANIPDEVRHNIQSYLNRIRKERWWEATSRIAVVPDSNINTGPNIKTVTILGQPFQLSEDATEKSGIGIESAFDAQVRPRVLDNVRMGIGVNLYSLDYSKGDFDERSVAIRMGPVVSFDRGELEMLGQGFKRWFGGKSYSYGFGPAFRTTYDASYDWQLTGWANYVEFDNDVDNALDGFAFAFNADATHTLNDRSLVRLFGGWGSDNRRERSASSNLYHIGIGMSRELPWGLVGYIAPEFQRRPYSGTDPLFGQQRSDDLYRIEGRVIFGREILPDLTPFISVQLEKNESNIDFYSYERIRGSIGFTKRF